MRILFITLLVFSFSVAGDRFDKIDSLGNYVMDTQALSWEAVEDKTTNLIWEHVTTTTGANEYTWGEAITYCNNLTKAGKTDWRLPNKYELLSLVDFDLSNPVIDSSYFTGITEALYIWTSTSYSTSQAWQLKISDGYMYYQDKTQQINRLALCVRAGYTE